MKTNFKDTAVLIDRRRERGAALITTLLLATMLLTAGGALVLSTTLSATTAIDSTAEMQAYYGAEAGLHATVNTLRGNVWNDSATPTASVRAIVEPAESNASGDDATDKNIARLSRWLTYNSNDRIVVPGTDNLIAYDVTAHDPDDSKNVTYSTSGVFSNGSDSITLGDGVKAFVQFYRQPQTTLLAYPAVSGRSLGRFEVTLKVEAGPAITIIAPDDPDAPRFLLKVNQTGPWRASDTFFGKISGRIEAGNIRLQIDFNGSTAKTGGTAYALEQNPLILVSSNAPAVPANKPIPGTITAPQPRRVLVRATGHGPKGAIKRLEMILNQSVFDFDAPAMLTLRGADNCNSMTFDTGSSGAKNYSGADNYNAETQLPAFAVSGCDLTEADGGISKHDTVADPEIAYLDVGAGPGATTIETYSVGTPNFLESANSARAALDDLQAAATAVNRYFTPATGGGSVTVTASNTTPDGITFVEGDCELEGGSGLLIVTGNLNMNGNPSFSGLILVLGEGTVNRDGGGEGTVYGAMVVASFNRTGNSGFRAPTFITNGGGNSTLQYDSLAVSRSMKSVGASVGGIREY